MTFEILFENDEILVINKPCGTAVQGGKGISHPLDEELAKQTGFKVHLVHRLDRETSGILIVAKNPAAASKWIHLIQTKEVQKEYVAFCFGTPFLNGKPVVKGTIEGVVEAHGRQQSAVTYFDVEKTGVVHIPEGTNQQTGEAIPAEDVQISKLHLTLGTGRMHQLRIQLASVNSPIIQDDQHGNFKLNKKIRRAGLKKLCLAAVKLTLPVDGVKKVFQIPLPEHMAAADALLYGQDTSLQ